MNESATSFALEVETTTGLCPAGEAAAKQMMAEGRIPVISCEGACIHGEIARQAANMVARGDPYGRGCHGAMFTAPHSAMAAWAKSADKVVVIDGCFIHCHGRTMGPLVGPDKSVAFNAMSFYKSDAEGIAIDAVPQAEREAFARQVADGVLAALAGEADPPAGP